MSISSSGSSSARVPPAWSTSLGFSMFLVSVVSAAVLLPWFWRRRQSAVIRARRPFLAMATTVVFALYGAVVWLRMAIPGTFGRCFSSQVTESIPGFTIIDLLLLRCWHFFFVYSMSHMRRRLGPLQGQRKEQRRYTASHLVAVETADQAAPANQNNAALSSHYADTTTGSKSNGASAGGDTTAASAQERTLLERYPILQSYRVPLYVWMLLTAIRVAVFTSAWASDPDYSRVVSYENCASPVRLPVQHFILVSFFLEGTLMGLLGLNLRTAHDCFLIKVELVVTASVGSVAPLAVLVSYVIAHGPDDPILMYAEMVKGVAALVGQLNTMLLPLAASYGDKFRVRSLDEDDEECLVLDRFLCTSTGFRHFEEHATKEWSLETLQFWQKVTAFETKYRSSSSSSGGSGSSEPSKKLLRDARQIYEDFIAKGAPNQVNLPSKITRQIMRDLGIGTTIAAAPPGGAKTKKKKVHSSMYEDGKLSILRLVYNDSFRRFLRVPEHADEFKRFLESQKEMAVLDMSKRQLHQEAANTSSSHNATGGKADNVSFLVGVDADDDDDDDDNELLAVAMAETTTTTTISIPNTVPPAAAAEENP